MSHKINDEVNENLLELHTEGKCPKDCQFCKEEEIDMEVCEDCLNSGLCTQGIYDEHGALVDTITKKCHCMFDDEGWDNDR